MGVAGWQDNDRHARAIEAVDEMGVADNEAREWILANPELAVRIATGHVDESAPVNPPRRSHGPMTNAEHALVAKLGECYTEWLVMCREDDQRQAPGRHAPDGLGHIEFAAHIHDPQNAVLARAMRRVYPDRYRP